jgi:hypothetical protein
MKDILRVVKVFPREGYKLHVFFSNGECREFEMSGMLAQRPYQQLNDPIAFRHIHIDDVAGTVAWLSGQDISPAILYEQSRPLDV